MRRQAGGHMEKVRRKVCETDRLYIAERIAKRINELRISISVYALISQSTRPFQRNAVAKTFFPTPQPTISKHTKRVLIKLYQPIIAKI